MDVLLPEYLRDRATLQEQESELDASVTTYSPFNILDPETEAVL
jgi:hypothetical protein